MILVPLTLKEASAFVFTTTATTSRRRVAASPLAQLSGMTW